MDEGRAIYEAHKRHMERRKTEPGYFHADCPACKMHQEQDDKAVEKKNDYHDRVDQSKEYLTQRRRLRHQGD